MIYEPSSAVSAKPSGHADHLRIAQVLLNVIDFGMSIEETVRASRFNCQGDVIDCHARIPEYVCTEVRRHRIQRMAQSHGGLALVHAIFIDPESGQLRGAGDGMVQAV